MLEAPRVQIGESAALVLVPVGVQHPAEFGRPGGALCGLCPQGPPLVPGSVEL